MSSDAAQDPPSKSSRQQDDDLLLDQSVLDALLAEAAQEGGQRNRVVNEPSFPVGDENTALSLSQADIDALLNNEELGRPSEGSDMESVIPSGRKAEAGPLDQSSIDALIAEMAPASSAPSPKSDNMVSQEMIDALIMAAAHDENAPPPRMVETVSAPEQAEMVSAAELDAALEQTQEEQRERYGAKQRALIDSPSEHALPMEPAPTPITEKQGKLHRDVRRPRMPRISMPVDMLRLMSSVAAGSIAAAAMFTFLYTHQERTPEPLSTIQVVALPSESENAPESQVPGAMPETPSEATGATPAPVMSDTEADKEFEALRTAFQDLKDNASQTEIELLHARMTDFIRSAATYPKLPEVYEWKVVLYEREHRTAMVRETDKVILARFQEVPHLDNVLLSAAKAALELGQPKEAMGYAQRLLDEKSDSPLAPEAELVLADAYAATSRLEDARTIWSRLAKEGPDTAFGLQATARLGKALIDEGRFADAVNLLEPCVNAAGKVEGNESLYYLMARAYRGVGRLEDARRRLNDILTFFGNSTLIPDTLIELSQVLGELGLRSDAVQMARDAAQRFPKNAAVLRNEGNLLASNGEKREAAEVLLNAAQNGIKEANVLLDAARDFRAAEALPEAQKTYERMLAEYPRAPVTLDANIELAEVIYELGQTNKAIRRLEKLLEGTAEGPPRLPILFSMAKLYQGLGLKTPTAEIYRHIAGLSNEPEVLARAAAALLDAGMTDDGLAVAERVDLKKVSEKTAYDLLVSEADAVSITNAGRSFEYLEKAYTDYPKQRTPDVERQLMRAYAARDDVSRAQELLASLDALAKETPADVPRLREAAVTWADHLYDKKDYRAAADWYARAVEGNEGKEPSMAWAAYQLGNARLQLDDLEGGAKAFEQAAASGGEWALDAQIKANYARVGQRLRSRPASVSSKANGGRG